VRRVEYFVKETLQAFRRNGFIVFAAISTAFIALFLLGGAILVQREVHKIAASVEANVEVSVFLDDDISSTQQANLQQMLETMPQTKTVSYESKDEAYQKFLQLFKDQPDLTRNVSPDALPASFQVQLNDPNQFGAIAQQLQGQPGISTIRDNKHIYDRLLKITAIFRWGVLVVAIVMLVASMALIGNTVRMAVFARRKEIGIMRLVGATNWTIRIPFLMEGLVEGVLGAAAAIFALMIMMAFFIDPIRGTIQFLPLVGSSDILYAAGIILLAAVGVAIVAGFFATRRYLDV
jgi:cell division transport system permease protein